MNDLTSLQNAYADALFSLSEERGATEKVLLDVKALCVILNENPSYLKMLDSPALSLNERLGLIDGAFSTLSRDLLNTVKLLAEKRLCRLLLKVLLAFISKYESSRGIERVEAISSIPLSKEQIERLKEKLEVITKKQIVISNIHDPSILGGIKLRYMDKELDGSMKTRLRDFEKKLSELVI
jgi:F-type H+-transporting ATPase subunit delta